VWLIVESPDSKKQLVKDKGHQGSREDRGILSSAWQKTKKWIWLSPSGNTDAVQI
jgi:hypothetical protein